MSKFCSTFILVLLTTAMLKGYNGWIDGAERRVNITASNIVDINTIDKNSPYKVDKSPTLQAIKYESLFEDRAALMDINLTGKYSDLEGVLTFRGNNYRDSAAWGRAKLQDKKLEKTWELDTSFRSFGGGGGWTGQPAIVKWPEQVRSIMGIKDKFKTMKDFTEVIFASLDGKIYFLELQSGEQTREPIDIKNTIKGSVAIDPRGYPMLYVGQGLNESGKIGYRIFSLIDNKLLYFIDGKDSFAYRSWSAFDGAPLIDKEADTMILGGENGLLYTIKLNTSFKLEQNHISVAPEVSKYRYKIAGNGYQGIENSLAIYGDTAYFADNGGSIQAVDLKSLTPLWTAPKTDDTDASITIKPEKDLPFLYTGCEVDKQGSRGISTVRKINGITGETVWSKEYLCKSVLGEHPVNGGMLASNIIGKNSLEKMVVFTLARYQKLSKGLMVALNCTDGSELWRWEMPNYSWSSPVDIYDEAGIGYIIQGDSVGKLYLLEGKSGAILDFIALEGNIESSPAVFDSNLVLATRGGKLYGIKIK